MNSTDSRPPLRNFGPPPDHPSRAFGTSGSDLVSGCRFPRIWTLGRVMRCALSAILLACATPLIAGEAIEVNSTEVETAPMGRLMLMGGAVRPDSEIIWAEFARLAGGDGARIAIFPTASANPVRTGEGLVRRLRAYGLDPFVVPAATHLPDTDYRTVVDDPTWIKQVREADAIFLAGGEQSRYRKVLVNSDESPTPLLQAIWHVYRKGGVVAGTSAGTAVMSRAMFVDADFVLPVMTRGVRIGEEVDHGLGFMPADCFVDQHFLARGRFGRALVAMQAFNFLYGLGIDEDTAAVVERGVARIVGYRGTILLDAKKSIKAAQESRFNVANVKLSYLTHGDSVDLKTLKVEVAQEKQREHKIDPGAPDFRPEYPQRQFYNDILTNTTLVELMVKLVNSPHNEATGLAFDGRAALQGPTPGFEFRFYRQDDTVGWEAPQSTGDPHTVLNVYLNVRPIEIKGPLYQ